MAPLDVEFVSRGYELDARGVVPPHVLLRYMEHMRWENALKSTTDVDSILRSGRSFVVVAQTVQILRYIGMAVRMRGTVWVGRIGRTSMDFHHVIHRTEDSELLVTGNVTIVYLGTDGTPTPLPERLRHARSDSPWTVEPKPPEFTAIPSQTFDRQYRVRADDLDLLQHVNQANYAAFYDDARQIAASRNVYGKDGLGGGRIRLLHIEYSSSAVMGEELSVGTWLVRTEPLTLGFVLRHDDDMLSRAVALVGN